MSDALDEVLDRHRQIWRERMAQAVMLATCLGVVIGYLARAWFG